MRIGNGIENTGRERKLRVYGNGRITSEGKVSKV